MEWVLGIAVVVAAVVAVVVVGRVRKARLQARVRLELHNEGNVRSRYDLRAEEPEGVLRFEFSLGGDSLPLHGPVAAAPAPTKRQAERPSRDRPAPKSGGARQKANAVIQTGGAVAGLLSMVGSLLPRSVGIPLQQKASEMRRVQAQASYAQQVPNQVAWLKSSAARAVPGAPAAKPAEAAPPPEPSTSGPEFTWAQTPYVPPGESLAVELLVRSALPAHNQEYAYQVLSRSADQAAAALVAAEGRVRIRGGFWARRFLPYLLIGATTVVLLLLVYWLASSGVLA
jgi:hypothetical protein